jgi:hypothetical protein
MQAQENCKLILTVFAGAPVVLLQILIRSIFYGLQSLHTHSHTLSLPARPLGARSRRTLSACTLGAHSRRTLLAHGPSRRTLSAHDALGAA